MQLPYGTLASSHRGAADMKVLGETIAKDGLTGYLRVSVFDKSAVRECVIVYNGGMPVISFASDGTTDRKDPDYRHMDEAIRKEQAIVEVCHLQDKQVKLLQDIYREFAPAQAAAPVKPAAKEPPRVTATPRQEEKVRPAQEARPAQAPEIRGRFVRAENIGDLGEYMQKHPGETGHLLFMTQLNGRQEEQHIILIKGRIEVAYNDRASGPELLEKLKGVPGQAEVLRGHGGAADVHRRQVRPDDQPAGSGKGKAGVRHRHTGQGPAGGLVADGVGCPGRHQPGGGRDRRRHG